MNFLSKSRGLSDLLLRIFSVLRRFGLTSRKFDKLLINFGQMASNLGFKPTFAITAVTLKRNHKVVKELSRNGIEFAIHGYIHTDYGVLPLEEQQIHFRQAIDTFTKCSVPYTGYRAPFLRTNKSTPLALTELGFSYDSSRTVDWDVLDKSAYISGRWREYERLLEFYRSQKSQDFLSLPKIDNGLVEIPVSIPDDEALVERLGVTDPDAISAIWRAIFQKTYDEGELFTLQLHPERILLCELALSNVIKHAKQLNPSVWVATLREISDWWREKNQFTMQIYPEGNKYFAIKALCSEKVTILLRNCQVNVSADKWYGNYRVINSRDFSIECDVRPVIGISPGTSLTVENFLRGEGYIVERDEQADKYALYFNHLEPFREEDEKPLIKKIEQSDAPLLRYWRWPDRARSALSITGDIDAITLIDFSLRILENWRQKNKHTHQ